MKRHKSILCEFICKKLCAMFMFCSKWKKNAHSGLVWLNSDCHICLRLLLKKIGNDCPGGCFSFQIEVIYFNVAKRLHVKPVMIAFISEE